VFHKLQYIERQHCVSNSDHPLSFQSGVQSSPRPLEDIISKIVVVKSPKFFHSSVTHNSMLVLREGHEADLELNRLSTTKKKEKEFLGSEPF